MTNRNPPSTKPTRAELDVLQTLWETGPATVKQVHAAMAARRDGITYANVLRLMQIMHGKGVLTRDESQRSHVYAAAQSQKATQGSLIKDLIGKAFAGSGKALVLTALRGGYVSKKDRAEIEALLRDDKL